MFLVAVLEVTNGEYGDCVDKLALAIKETDWRNSITTTDGKFQVYIFTFLSESRMLTNPINYFFS